jgi:hypothetical protein
MSDSGFIQARPGSEPQRAARSVQPHHTWSGLRRFDAYIRLEPEARRMHTRAVRQHIVDKPVFPEDLHDATAVARMERASLHLTLQPA